MSIRRKPDPVGLPMRVFFALGLTGIAAFGAANFESIWSMLLFVPIAYVIGLVHGSAGREIPSRKQHIQVEQRDIDRRASKAIGKLSSDAVAAVRAEIENGSMISAIKLMKEFSGLGLAEAKDAVEYLDKQKND